MSTNQFLFDEPIFVLTRGSVTLTDGVTCSSTPHVGNTRNERHKTAEQQLKKQKKNELLIGWFFFGCYTPDSSHFVSSLPSHVCPALYMHVDEPNQTKFDKMLVLFVHDHTFRPGRAQLTRSEDAQMVFWKTFVMLSPLGTQQKKAHLARLEWMVIALDLQLERLLPSYP